MFKTKIIGNTTATPMAVPDWNQTDNKKSDYIKNKPTIGVLASKDTVEQTDLSEGLQARLDEFDAIISTYILNIDYDALLAFDTTEIVVGSTTNTTSVLGQAVLGQLVLA